MTETKKGFIQLHTSVLLAGFTGLFGRLITLNEVDIVWYRMLFTTSILVVFTGLPRVGWRKFLQLCGCGALLGFHWILFYGSIKASNVSIGVICFSLIGFFTAIFEPLIFKKRLSWIELLFSLITVAGVLCIFSLDARYRYGISIGIVSSAVCALYVICNCFLQVNRYWSSRMAATCGLCCAMRYSARWPCISCRYKPLNGSLRLPST